MINPNPDDNTKELEKEKNIYTFVEIVRIS